MRFFEIYHIQPSIWTGILDAFILTATSFPALYIFFYRPMKYAFNERKKLQRGIILADKLAAVGLLASSIAHEINNPINNILGITQVLQKEGGLPPSIRADLQTIEKESQRVGYITKNLLNFSKNRDPQKELFTLLELANKTLPLIEQDFIQAGIVLIKKISSPSPSIYANPIQIEQVLINILLNAKYALKKRKNKQITIAMEPLSDIARITITDNGHGISEKDQSRIFDPFFTTKPPTHGTGLGLSISHVIITENGGTIKADSTPGCGARFTIEFPQHSSKST